MVISVGKCFPMFTYNATIKIKAIQLFGPCCFEKVCLGENELLFTIVDNDRQSLLGRLCVQKSLVHVLLALMGDMY